MFNKAADH